MSRKFFRSFFYSDSDEFLKENVFEDGKRKVVDLVELDHEKLWNNYVEKQLLIVLFQGPLSYNDLFNIFYEARSNEFSARNEDPFPYGQHKAMFLKSISLLKTYGLVKQIGGDAISDGSSMFSLDENGVNFIKKKLKESIQKENFDIFMAILCKDDAGIFIPFFVMKLIEYRKVDFDQLAVVIENREDGMTFKEVVRDYVEYLKDVEGESTVTENDELLVNAVMKKLASLTRMEMVTVGQNSKYIMTEKGKKILRIFEESIKPVVEMLERAYIITIENETHLIKLTKAGKLLANEIKDDYSHDLDRIINYKAGINDIDDHETRTILPIWQYARRVKEENDKKPIKIFTKPVRKKPIKIRLYDALPAVLVGLGCGAMGFAALGLLLMFRNFQLGAGIVMGSFAFAMLSLCSYPASVAKTKKRLNFMKESKKERKTWYNFLKTVGKDIEGYKEWKKRKSMGLE
jgi:predicted transcriptional regulator